MSLAAFSARDAAMTWVGVGNVTGLLLRADREAARPREALLSRGGVVGYHLPSLYPAVHSVYPGDTLIFATDGLRSSFAEDVMLDDSPQQIADHLLDSYSRGTDDALVLVARCVGKSA
jgi:serine/threonine protein phosphatase PrpC